MPTFGVSAERPAEGPKVGVQVFRVFRVFSVGGPNPEKVVSRSQGPRRVGPRRVGGPKFSRFSSLSRHSFHSFLQLLLVLSLIFGGV